MEGTFPEDAGCWNTTLSRVQCGWGMVDGKDWNSSDQSNPTEPSDIDRIAKRHRLGRYYRIRNSDDVIKCLNRRYPVLAAFEVTRQWLSPPDGVIKEVPEYITPSHSHAVVIKDYSEEYDAFIFTNSWGKKWGKNGDGLMTRSYFDSWMIDSWFPYDFENPAKEYLHPGAHVSRGVFNTIIGVPHFMVSIYDPDTDEKIGWSICCERDGFFDVEELFVRPIYRKQGYGKLLISELKGLAEDKKLPIRLWISYADSYQENHQNLFSVASKIGLKIQKTTVSWAGYVATRGKTSTVLPIIRIPDRPKATQQELINLVEPTIPIVSTDLEEKIWARMARKARINQEKRAD